MVQGKKCLGLLKTGKKNLFIRTADSSLKEIKPLCVLDFYVHESCQRNGIGKVRILIN
jgi:alpha-tubulin N-acetyltransferase 1